MQPPGKEERRVLDAARRVNQAERVFVGYHQFRDALGNPYGSFEVVGPDTHDLGEPGYYWISGFPGYLPDSDPVGPFPTAEGAYLDAIGD